MLVHPLPGTGLWPPPRYIADIPPIIATPLVCIAWLLGSGAWTNCESLCCKLRGHLPPKSLPSVSIILQLQPLHHPHDHRQHSPLQAVHIFTTEQHATLVQATLFQFFHHNVSNQGLSGRQYRVICPHNRLTQMYIEDHRSIQEGSISFLRILPRLRDQDIRHIVSEALLGLPKSYFFIDQHPHVPDGILLTYSRDHKHTQEYIDHELVLHLLRLQANGQAIQMIQGIQPILQTPPPPANPPTMPPSPPTTQVTQEDLPVMAPAPSSILAAQPDARQACHWNPSTFPSAVDWTYLLATPTNIFQWKPTKPLTKSPPTHLNHRRWLMSLLKQHQATAWDINFYPRLWRLAGHGSTC